MTTKVTITSRLEILKEWQKNNAEKINFDPHLEGYNAAVNSEILFLEQILIENKKRIAKKTEVTNERRDT